MRDRMNAPLRAGRGLAEVDRDNLMQQEWAYERGVEASLAPFGFTGPEGWLGPPDVPALGPLPSNNPAWRTVYRRDPGIKGPMDGFGYSWLDDHLKKAGLGKPALLSREPLWEGPSFGYETLNLVDGRRDVRQIRDALAASVGPAPVEEVAAYLAVLERLGVIRR
jgi:hypothetical protein